jgi:hypothetical protein
MYGITLIWDYNTLTFDIALFWEMGPFFQVARRELAGSRAQLCQSHSSMCRCGEVKHKVTMTITIITNRRNQLVNVAAHVHSFGMYIYIIIYIYIYIYIFAVYFFLLKSRPFCLHPNMDRSAGHRWIFRAMVDTIRRVV